MEGFMRFLAPDVVLVSGGGGPRRAALRPILGADRVRRFVAGILARPDGALTAGLRELNGETAMVLYAAGEPDSVAFLTVEPRGVSAIHIIRNPEKLSHLASWG